MTFLPQHYGPTEGPLGFPMLDKAAQALDAILQGLPKSGEFAYRKVVSEKAPSELLTGERADVSWITCEDPDRANEVVLTRGIDESQFQLNPIVTLQHAYHLPPVGKSLWRRVVKDGARRGVKAKTHYPPRPASWSEASWPADVAFSLVQADLLRGKSIGFASDATELYLGFSCRDFSRCSVVSQVVRRRAADDTWEDVTAHVTPSG